MILLTDISFFQGDLEIVNLLESASIEAELKGYIRQHEPKLLGDVLGWELYSALQTALLVNPLGDNFQKLLFGDTYAYQGRQRKWKGIIESDAPTFSFGTGVAGYRNPEWIVVGETTSGGTVIIPDNGKTFTMPAWIGWEPIIFRYGAGPMKKGTDYSYNSTTGAFALLDAEDAFTAKESLFVQFQLQYSAPNSSPAISYKRSFIANYIYWHWQQKHASFSTGTGEKVVNTANTIAVSPADKMVIAWNEMSEWITELWQYLEANKAYYPDWYYVGYKQLRDYRKINPYGI
jgi:hypothetical protein